MGISAAMSAGMQVHMSRLSSWEVLVWSATGHVFQLPCLVFNWLCSRVSEKEVCHYYYCTQHCDVKWMPSKCIVWLLMCAMSAATPLNSWGAPPPLTPPPDISRYICFHQPTIICDFSAVQCIHALQARVVVVIWSIVISCIWIDVLMRCCVLWNGGLCHAASLL
jgi:hypothetical protein